MARKVIAVENVSKIYRLGEIGTGTLSADINRWWVKNVMGKDDPYLKIGQTNIRSQKGESEIVFSLKDVCFDVQQGDVLGIIGKNGAGKSTLLKILSRITSPTTGRVKMKGRVASLLEVGTGFHPELTGRENIFLNGSILGMRKNEIFRKLDEIIDFSGVERYIDTPVKRYSSGMYVRLAFAVAAHLESEILIVDEVLAVGDSEFQQKCLGRMKDVSNNDGRTVLFVSHHLPSLRNICNNGILLENGIISMEGNINKVISNYVDFNKVSDQNKIVPSGKSVCFVSFEVDFLEIQSSQSESTISAIFKLNIKSDYDFKSVDVGIGINDNLGNRIITLYSHFYSKYFDLDSGVNSIECHVDNWNLRPGRYFIVLSLGSNGKVLDYCDQAIYFDLNLVQKQNLTMATRMDSTQGHQIVEQKWMKL